MSALHKLSYHPKSVSYDTSSLRRYLHVSNPSKIAFDQPKLAEDDQGAMTDGDGDENKETLAQIGA